MAFRDVTTKDLGPKAKKVQKMATEELLMSVIPIARIGKLAKLIKGLGKGKKAPKKGELKSMLEERGFKKLASVDPTLNELEVFLKKRAPEGMEDEIIRISARQDGEKSLTQLARKAAEAKVKSKTVKFKRTQTPMRTTSEAFPGGSGYGAPKGTKGSRETYRDFTNPRPRKKEIRKALRQESKPKASERPIPPAPVGTTPKRTEGFVDKIKPDDIPELYSRIRKMRGPKNAMTTSPRGGDMTVEILPNDLMLVTDPKTQTTERFRGKVRAGGKILEWVPEVGLPRRFNRRAIQEINDHFGVNLVPPADLGPILRKAAEVKAKK